MRTPALPDGAVVWSTVVADDVTVLPDGCMDVIWTGGHLVVTGADTVARRASVPRGARVTGVRFAPGDAAAALGVAADELTDSQVRLVELRPELGDVDDLVGSAADPSAAVVDVVGLLGPVEESHRRFVRVVAAATEHGSSVSEIAACLGVGPRHLRRRCREAFGLSPAALRRVLRLQRAIATAQGAASLAEVAVRAGYADQSHLARDVRAMADTTPALLLGSQPAVGANRSTAPPSGSSTTA